MAQHAIERRLIGGVWQTVDVEEDSGGGGDSSGLEVIGPFPVAWDEPDLATGVTLASLTDGQIVINAWAIAHDVFDGGGFFTIGVVVGPTTYAMATLSTTAAIGDNVGLFPAVILNAAWSSQAVVSDAGTLQAFYDASPTHGLVDVYALVWTPPA